MNLTFDFSMYDLTFVKESQNVLYNEIYGNWYARSIN